MWEMQEVSNSSESQGKKMTSLHCTTSTTTNPSSQAERTNPQPPPPPSLLLGHPPLRRRGLQSRTLRLLNVLWKALTMMGMLESSLCIQSAANISSNVTRCVTHSACSLNVEILAGGIAATSQILYENVGKLLTPLSS